MDSLFNAVVFQNSTIWTWIILAPLAISAALPAFKVCQPAVLGKVRVRVRVRVR